MHIRNYVFIINVRMNQSIQLSIHIEKSLFEYVVPRLSIQPLVENAIQHGLMNKRGDKKIDIGADAASETLEVWVEDNGVGMDMDKINERLENSLDDALSKSESIGLDNINARAKLLYGNEYGVTINSKINEGSRVVLRIPLISDVDTTPEKNGSESTLPGEGAP